MTSMLPPRHYAVPVLILETGQFTATCSACDMATPLHDTEAAAQADCDAHEDAVRWGRAV